MEDINGCCPICWNHIIDYKCAGCGASFEPAGSTAKPLSFEEYRTQIELNDRINTGSGVHRDIDAWTRKYHRYLAVWRP